MCRFRIEQGRQEAAKVIRRTRANYPQALSTEFQNLSGPPSQHGDRMRRWAKNEPQPETIRQFELPTELLPNILTLRIKEGIGVMDMRTSHLYRRVRRARPGYQPYPLTGARVFISLFDNVLGD